MTEESASRTGMPSLSPRITIITVCLNAEKHLAEAMWSVLGQGYANLDYVVVDGGSTDRTLEIVRSFEGPFGERLRWMSESDEGLYHAMNKGVALARGDVIGILNADDVFEPGALDAVAEAYGAHPSAGVFYGGTCNADRDGACVTDRPAPEAVTPQALMDGMVFCHQSMFVAAWVYRDLGTYDIAYRILSDQEFVMRCLKAEVPFVRVDRRLSRFRLGGVSQSDVRALDRERTLLRIAYGGSPALQWARYYKHGVSIAVHRALQKLGTVGGKDR